MKILRFTFLFLLLMPDLSLCQSREAGIMIGVMGYKGDLDPNTYDTRFLDPGFGVLYRRCYSNHWAFKVTANYGHVSASDEEADNEWAKNRNLQFRSSILELSGQVEFNFFPYQTASPFAKFSPYLLAGYSLFRFNPKAEINGEWIALQPLGTEGQGTSANPEESRYKRTSLAFTYGGGFKIRLSRRFGCTLETAVRQTYTDYLDDVSTVYADPLAIRKEYGKAAATLSDRSLEKAPGGNIGRQRGDRKKRDWYVFTGIQFTYTLSKKYIDSCQPFRIKLW